MDNDFNFEKAEKLLLSKGWAELTDKEKAFLAGEFDSEMEYEAMREHLLNVSPMVETDLPDLEADPAILMRLNNAMDLRPKTMPQPQQRPIQRNSMLGGLLLLLTFNSVGLKASLAMVVVVFSLWFGGPRVGDSHGTFADTTATHSFDTSQLQFDTINVRPMLFTH